MMSVSWMKDKRANSTPGVKPTPVRPQSNIAQSTTGAVNLNGNFVPHSYRIMSVDDRGYFRLPHLAGVNILGNTITNLFKGQGWTQATREAGRPFVINGWKGTGHSALLLDDLIPIVKATGVTAIPENQKDFLVFAKNHYDVMPDNPFANAIRTAGNAERMRDAHKRGDSDAYITHYEATQQGINKGTFVPNAQNQEKYNKSHLGAWKYYTQQGKAEEGRLALNRYGNATDNQFLATISSSPWLYYGLPIALLAALGLPLIWSLAGKNKKKNKKQNNYQEIQGYKQNGYYAI